MNGDGGAVQVAFELDAGLLDESLVIGIVGYGRKLLDGTESANPLQVDIGESVRAGKEASRLRRGVPAQFNNDGDSRDDGQNADDNGEATACPYAHGGVAGPLLPGINATASRTTPQNGQHDSTREAAGSLASTKRS